RLVEIGHGMGETELRVTDWGKVLSVLANNAAVGKLFGLSDARREAIAALAQRHQELSEALRKAQEHVKAAETQEKKAEDKEHAHLALIVEHAFRGMAQVSYQPNFIDQRLTAPKLWRDVYHDDAKDQCTGWTRYHSDRAAEEFNHEGLLVVEKDDLGRCKKAR